MVGGWGAVVGGVIGGRRMVGGVIGGRVVGRVVRHRRCMVDRVVHDEGWGVVDNDGRVQGVVAGGTAQVGAAKQGACVLIVAVAAGVEAVGVLVALRGRHGRAPDERQHPREFRHNRSKTNTTPATNAAAGLCEEGVAHELPLEGFDI